MSHPFIPLTRSTVTGDELHYIQSAIDSRQLAGNGPLGRRVEAILARETGSEASLLTTSCTHALEMCALLLDLKPGDEVIVPSYTFVSTANAFALRGASVLFADVQEDTLNIDVSHAESLISPRTRAIVCVHYGGVGCDMAALSTLTKRHGIALIEDNAHGLFGRYRGRPLGSFGSLATLSFHETKNFTCGEGGALIVNDAALLERAEIIREKGTDRSRFMLGAIDKYTWRDLGSSYVLSDLLAGYLLAQLESHERVLERRQHAYDFYAGALQEWAEAYGIRQPVIPPDCRPSWHLYHLVLPEPRHQGPFITHMKAAGIGCAFHYVPLNLTPYGQQLGGTVGECPVAESAAQRLVRLPLHAELSDQDLERVVAAARAWRPH